MRGVRVPTRVVPILGMQGGDGQGDGTVVGLGMVLHEHGALRGTLPLTRSHGRQQECTLGYL